MNARKRILAGLVATVAVAAVAAPSASGATVQRQLFCDPEAGYAAPNALGELAPIDCANGEYNPETETYEPYDAATDDEGLLGLGKATGTSLFGL